MKKVRRTHKISNRPLTTMLAGSALAMRLSSQLTQAPFDAMNAVSRNEFEHDHTCEYDTPTMPITEAAKVVRNRVQIIPVWRDLGSGIVKADRSISKLSFVASRW